MAGRDQPERRGLQDYLPVVRRNLLLVVGVTVVAVVVAVALSVTQHATYTSKGRLLVQPATSVFDNTDKPPSADFVQTEVQFLESDGVRKLVRDGLGAAPKVDAVQVGTTSVVQVTAQGPSPVRAKNTVDAYMNAYLTFRSQAASEALNATSRQVQAAVDDLQRQIDALTAQLRATNCPTGCPERTAVEQDRDARVQEQVPFREKLSQLNIDSSSARVGAVVVPASVPTAPASPKPARNGVLALVLGALLGIGLAILFEAREDAVRDGADLERFVPDLALLAVIPGMAKGDASGPPQVIAVAEPASPAAEAYRSLRTSIRFLAVDRDVRSIQVTSATESEGKTTTAANLGFVLARAGELVVMVDCDLRRPRLHEYFGRENTVGLTSVVLGEATLGDAIQPLTEDRRLWLLPAGPRPPNPADLLSSSRVMEVLEALQKRASVLVLDCPPVLAASDAAIVSGKVDGTLLVVRAGVSGRKKVTRAVETLGQIGAPVLGAVLHTPSGARAGEEGYWVSGSQPAPVRRPSPEGGLASVQSPRKRRAVAGRSHAEAATSRSDRWAEQGGTAMRAAPGDPIGQPAAHEP